MSVSDADRIAETLLDELRAGLEEGSALDAIADALAAALRGSRERETRLAPYTHYAHLSDCDTGFAFCFPTDKACTCGLAAALASEEPAA